MTLGTFLVDMNSQLTLNFHFTCVAVVVKAPFLLFLSAVRLTGDLTGPLTTILCTSQHGMCLILGFFVHNICLQ